MHIDPLVALAGLAVGFTVGLTGMGGGALMTPLLVLLFKVEPLAAVSSDVVASMVMKPVGGAVHLRRGTVNKSIVGWLMLGSVPSAFIGVLILRQIGSGAEMQHRIKLALGVALIVAAVTMVARAVLNVRSRAVERHRRAEGLPPARKEPSRIKPLPTFLVGVLGGSVVGMTSVGSGSLVIVALLMVYPTLKGSELIGTDLVQAIPLVASASLGHLLFGDFRMALTTSLLVGCLPGVYVGARLSARASNKLIRPVLALVLLASGLKLLELGTVPFLAVMLTVGLAGPLAWRYVRATDGLLRV